jgi:hypothetical protein
MPVVNASATIEGASALTAGSAKIYAAMASIVGYGGFTAGSGLKRLGSSALRSESFFSADGFTKRTYLVGATIASSSSFTALGGKKILSGSALAAKSGFSASACHMKSGTTTGDVVNAVLGIWGFSTAKCDAPGCSSAIDEAVVFVNQALQALYLRAKEFAFLGNERRYRDVGRWSVGTPSAFPTWSATGTYYLGQIVRYVPPQPGNEGIGELFRAVISRSPGDEPPLVNDETYGTVWDEYTLDSTFVSGPQFGKVDSFVGNVVMEFWDAENTDVRYTNALRPLPNVSALRQAREAYEGNYYPETTLRRPVAYFCEQTDNNDYATNAFVLELAPELDSVETDSVPLTSNTISVTIASNIATATLTFDRSLSDGEFAYLKDQIARGTLILYLLGGAGSLIGAPEFTSFTKDAAQIRFSTIDQAIANGVYSMTYLSSLPSGDNAGFRVPRQIISYDVRVLPRVCCNDLYSKIQIPHHLAESLLMPLARYFAMASRLFRTPEIAAQIQEQAAVALKAIGMAEPKAKEVRPNYKPADSVSA